MKTSKDQLFRIQQGHVWIATSCARIRINKNADRVGRPKYESLKEVLEELQRLGFSWAKESQILNVPWWTIMRRVEEYDLHH